MKMIPSVALALATVSVLNLQSADAAIDSQQKIVSANGQVASYAYKPGATPDQDQIFFAGSGAIAGLYRVDGVNRSSLDAPLPSTISTLVSATQYTIWEQGLTGVNDPTTVTLGQPVPQGMLLNPYAIGSTPAYSKAYIFDIAGAVRYNGVAQPQLAKRIYTWNLNAPSPASDTYGAGQVLTPLLTQTQYAGLAGTAVTNNPGQAKQPIFSKDGKTAFFVDISTGYGGLWRLNLETNAVTRLLTETSTGTGSSRFGVDPGITEVNGKDRIYVNGTTTTGNAEGLNYLDYDRTTGTVSSATAVLSRSQIETFLNASSGTIGIESIGVDGDNVYLSYSGGGSSATGRSGILRLDAQGRLSKVSTYNERKAAFGDVTVVAGKLQFRNTIDTYGNAVRQVMYAQSISSFGFVGGVYLYEPGDFNRDGLVNAADATLLKQPGVLSLVGQSTTNADLFKYDLNGDSPVASSSTPTAVVDFRDVKVFQQFFAFANGDADISQSLNLADLLTLQANYLGTNKIWTTGDFTGDNFANRTDLDVLASAWLGLGQPAPTFAEVDANFTGQYRLDVLNAFAIPEPSAIGTLLPAALLVLRRKKR